MNTSSPNHHQQLKLGRKKSPADRRTLLFSKYAGALPPPAAAQDWTSTVPTPCGMMNNDRVGCCVVAGAAHLEQVWTGNAAPPGFVAPDADVLTIYKQLSGYVEGDESTDTGLDPLSFLKFWCSQGIDGRKPLAYVSVNPKNMTEVMQAIQLFGGVFSAVELPLTAQQQTGGIWDLVPGDAVNGAPGSWGGHMAPCSAYDARGPYAITWGQWKQAMTWGFFTSYYDEVWAVLTADFIKANGISPSGFDLQTLQADLSLIA